MVLSQPLCGPIQTSAISVPFFPDRSSRPTRQFNFVPTGCLTYIFFVFSIVLTYKSLIMTSIIVVIIAIIGMIIIPSEAASISRPNDQFPGVTTIIEDMYPTGSDEYQVTVMGSDSLHINGCAFIDHKSTELIKKSFRVWIGKSHDGKQRCCEQGDYFMGMEQFRFSCQVETHSLSEDLNKQNTSQVYVHLRGRFNNNEQQFNLRCALFEMANNTLFRMVISKNDSCNGLSDLLSQPQPKIPEKTILMQLSKASDDHESYQLRFRRSTTNSNDTIKNSWEIPDIILLMIIFY